MSFTRAMGKALGAEANDFIIVYLDDNMIASNSLKEHLNHIDYVLSKLKQVDFKLNRSKCEFLRQQIKFLGHTYTDIEAEINRETKIAIQNFERPKTKNQKSYIIIFKTYQLG